MKAIDEKKLGGKLMRRVLLRFFLVVALYTVALILAVYFVRIVGHSWIIWYDPMDTLYRLLTFLEVRFLEIFPLIWGIGFLVILLYFWRQTIGYVIAIANGIGAILEPDTNLASLPGDLREVEGSLNQVKYDIMKSQQQAKEAEQRKNDLVVYLAHDLKTPLTSVIGYLSLLRDESQISEDLRGKYLSIAVTKAERLEELINEFFEITRFSLKGLTLDASTVNLTRMLEQIAYEFKPLLEPRNLSCSVTADPDIIMPGDANKLERVFDNLIRNAINYSHENSAIEISAVRSEQGVSIRFRNQGDTIPEHKLGHIFEQFYRLDDSRGTAKGGAGLGLAIAKEIVELHGGTITASSESGTTEFAIFLPSS